ncbi:MAG: tetratricopeptide repeat protein [Muribaculaceae bacterium]|nr:tetratricopeptide repeat protein [Muribaculaceae bacterium]
MKNILAKAVMATLMLSGALMAGAQQINPVTEAVLNSYNEALSEDPKDYVTLFDRASLYVDMGEYNRALSDIDMAIEYTPAKESDYRMAEYSLKADILSSMKEYDKAVAALEAALKINPSSQPELYKAGNLYLLANKPKEALEIFKRLQRENSRSQEAFYGMAKANVMLGNNDEASKLIEEIENLGKQSFITYTRIGDLYADMEKYVEATKNYVIAYTMTEENSRPLQSLKHISAKAPETVLSTLEGIIESQPDNVQLNYVKAILSYDAGRYDRAEKACQDLAKGLEEESPAVYRMMAMSQLAQAKQTEALQSIDKAESLAPGSVGVILDKADILLSSDPAKALEYADKALKIAPDDESALILKAKAAILAGKSNEALDALNNVIMMDPSNSQALLLKGHLNAELLKDEKAAATEYAKAGDMKGDGVTSLVYAALGKAKAGKKLDADGYINEAINKAGNDKDYLYLIAVYYAQTGNTAKAKEFLQKAIANGYNNQYNLKLNREPLLNLQPIRN